MVLPVNKEILKLFWKLFHFNFICYWFENDEPLTENTVNKEVNIYLRKMDAVPAPLHRIQELHF